MTTATTPADGDPTLVALVPRRSPARNALLVAIGAVVLLTAALSPRVLQPSIDTDGTYTWSALAGHGQTLETIEFTARGWPALDVRSIGEVPGARSVDAWVLTGTSARGGHAGDPTDHPSGLDFVRASFPHADLAATRLPQRLEDGATATLVVLWGLDDCAGLVEGRAPVLTLASVAGTAVDHQLSDFTGPAFDLRLLHELGICPPGSGRPAVLGLDP